MLRFIEMYIRFTLCAIQLLTHECQSDHFRNESQLDVRLPYEVSRARLSLFDVHWLTQYVRSNEVWKFHIPFEWLESHPNSDGNAHSERRLKNHMNYKNWRIIMYWFVSCWFWQTYLTGSERETARVKKKTKRNNGIVYSSKPNCNGFQWTIKLRQSKIVHSVYCFISAIRLLSLSLLLLNSQYFECK